MWHYSLADVSYGVHPTANANFVAYIWRVAEFVHYSDVVRIRPLEQLALQCYRVNLTTWDRQNYTECFTLRRKWDEHLFIFILFNVIVILAERTCLSLRASLLCSQMFQLFSASTVISAVNSFTGTTKGLKSRGVKHSPRATIAQQNKVIPIFILILFPLWGTKRFKHLTCVLPGNSSSK